MVSIAMSSSINRLSFISIVLLLSATVFFIAQPAFAATDAELQAQVTALDAQISALGGEPEKATTNATSAELQKQIKRLLAQIAALQKNNPGFDKKEAVLKVNGSDGPVHLRPSSEVRIAWNSKTAKSCELSLMSARRENVVFAKLGKLEKKGVLAFHVPAKGDHPAVLRLTCMLGKGKVAVDEVSLNQDWTKNKTGEVLGAATTHTNSGEVLGVSTSTNVNRQVSLQEMETLASKVKADTAMLERLNAQRADVLTQITGLVTQLQNDQKHLADLNKDKNSLPTGTSTVVADHSQIKTQMTLLEARIKQAKTMLTSVNALRADILTQMSGLRESIATNQSRITLLNKGVETLNESVASETASPSITLSASPSTVGIGESSTIAWSTRNAQRCVLQYGSSEDTIGTSGSKIVSPTVNTTYKVWCANDSGVGKDGPAAAKTVIVRITRGGEPSATSTTGTTTVSKKIPTHNFGSALKMCQRLKVMGVPGDACRQEVKEAYVELRQALALQEKIPRIAARKVLFNKILKAKLLEYKKQHETGTSTTTPVTTEGAGSADGGSSEGGSGDGGSGGGM